MRHEKHEIYAYPIILVRYMISLLCPVIFATHPTKPGSFLPSILVKSAMFVVFASQKLVNSGVPWVGFLMGPRFPPDFLQISPRFPPDFHHFDPLGSPDGSPGCQGTAATPKSACNRALEFTFSSASCPSHGDVSVVEPWLPSGELT